MADTSKARLWVIYDGRAAFGDTSSAAVLCCAESRREAAQDIQDYGDAVAYSYDASGGELSDRRGPYFKSKHGLRYGGEGVANG